MVGGTGPRAATETAEGRRLRLNLVGPGKVGQTICRLLADHGYHIVQDIFGRDQARASQAAVFIGQGGVVDDMAAMQPADIWLITVPDTRIGAVAELLATQRSGESAIALHCSGFLPASELEPLAGIGWHVASAHPAMSFADPAAAIAHFAGVRCALEGQPEALAVITPLLETIGARPFTIASEGKALYHAGAVLSNNLAVVLQAMAREAWHAAGVPDDVARELNAALLQTTAANVAALGPQAALTGPAARGDWSVVARQHQVMAEWNPVAGDAYEKLSILARRLKRTGSTGIAVDEEG